MRKSIVSILLISSMIVAVTPLYASSSFSDVKSNHWAYNAIDWGVTNGVINGYEDGTFKPEKNVTGTEFVSMLVRAVAPSDLSGISDNSWESSVTAYVKKRNWTVNPINNVFTRYNVAETISASLGNSCNTTSSVQLLLDTKLSQGKTSATVEGYKGDDTLTRAEAITFIQNFAKNYKTLQDKPAIPKCSYIELSKDDTTKTATTTVPVIVKNPLISGNYSISSISTNDSSITITALPNTPSKIWVTVEKDGANTNILDQYGQKFDLSSGLLQHKVYLPEGPGSYILSVLASTDGDSYTSVVYGNNVFKVTNTDSRDLSFSFPTDNVQSNDPEIVSLANQISSGVTDNVYNSIFAERNWS